MSGLEASRVSEDQSAEVADPGVGAGTGRESGTRVVTNTGTGPNAPGAPSRSAPTHAIPFRLVDRARWSDVDAAGIVCYGAYLRFFELAETELFRATGLTVASIQQDYGLWLVRRRVECDFHRSILLDEEVEIFAHAVNIGRTSLELAFIVRRLGELEVAVEARYVLVAVDHQELRPIPVPEPVRDALGPWLMSRETAREAL